MQSTGQCGREEEIERIAGVARHCGREVSECEWVALATGLVRNPTRHRQILNNPVGFEGSKMSMAWFDILT